MNRIFREMDSGLSFSGSENDLVDEFREYKNIQNVPVGKLYLLARMFNSRIQQLEELMGKCATCPGPEQLADLQREAWNNEQISENVQKSEKLGQISTENTKSYIDHGRYIVKNGEEDDIPNRDQI